MVVYQITLNNVNQISGGSGALYPLHPIAWAAAESQNLDDYAEAKRPA